MKMHCEKSASPSTSGHKKMQKSARRPASVLAMSALTASVLTGASFSVSPARADVKAGSKKTPRAQSQAARSFSPAAIKSELEAQGAVLNVRVNKTLALVLPDNAKYSLLDGAELLKIEVQDGLLILTGVQTGSALLVLESPFQGTQRFVVKMIDGELPDPNDTSLAMTTMAQTKGHPTVIAQNQVAPTAATSTTVSAKLSPARISAIAPTPRIIKPAAPSLPPLKYAGKRIPLVPGGIEVLSTPLDEAPAAPKGAPTFGAQGPGIVPIDNSELIGYDLNNAAVNASRVNSIRALTASTDVAQITPDVPMPTRDPSGVAFYPTESSLPSEIAMAVNDPSINRPQLSVSRGMARVMGFKQNILAVFFSDDSVMDARAVNARTLAVTGKSNGKSTLAIFLARTPDDVVGRAVIYNVDVYSSSTAVPRVGISDPATAEAAITAAISDPRVRVSVIQDQDGQLVARLSGAVRDKAEIEGANSTAALYVSTVISSLYADPNATSIRDLLTGPVLSEQDQLEAQLRVLFNNDTLDIATLAGSKVIRGTVASQVEAEAILNFLPSLNQQLQPFLSIRSEDGAVLPYISDTPLLYGPDYDMTRTLRQVTGISTVYIKRTASDGVAVYGTVRNRSDYDKIYRYARILPVNDRAGVAAANTGNGSNTDSNNFSSATPTANAGSGSGQDDSVPATAPFSANTYPIGIQMFVTILNPADAVIRQVSIESSLVEINRTSLRSLGLELGSQPTGSTLIVPAGTGSVTIGGGGALSVSPAQVRFNALVQDGRVKILSQPNVMAIEGASAQIIVGGQRPVPTLIRSNNDEGRDEQTFEFRRFGIILTMRPNVTDDNTIILQVRADITELDPSTSITVDDTTILGERVRSVDTTIVIRPGDTLVMGGLITNDNRVQTSRIPFLSKIPFLGNLFKSRSFQNNESELAIFLTPRLSGTPATPGGIDMTKYAGLGLPPLPTRQESQGGLDSVGAANR